ncbi:MAG: SusC/RagA family TonB-linked outer membrane protein, partial [Dysgonamonadaceae bacterium]|nr:SusC/RagA family TonB-linked outer membrane protein [Dysgonamonadaceae bacterium]
MRILFFLFMVEIPVIYANNSYSQITGLNINLKNKTIKEVFSEIEKVSEYVFLYHDDNLDMSKKVSVDAHNQTIDKILDEIFKDTDYAYYISDRQVFVSKSKSVSPEKNRQEQKEESQITITGVVIDSDGEPLVGATVALKSKKSVGVVANLDGKFAINVESMDETLVFSYIGMKTKELKLKSGATNYKVVMEYQDTQLGAVEISTGIIKRDKFGFTGSYSAITQEELKSVGNINVLQSLKSLDPAFVIVENNLSGSNPNVLANIELRGQTSMNITSVQDAAAITSNLPLFILDGFEASLQEINDLDINRVESITLLKDAGSTAIYGVKGANGVVVIETLKPKAGQVFISYSGDFQLAAPDLSVYNMMNAAEKLEFERLSGRYNKAVGGNEQGNVTMPEIILSSNNQHLQEIYYDRLAKIVSGVDTYWLSEPVRMAFTQSHSLTLSGGNDLQYIAGANYRNNQGVMKGSGRETYGGNLRLVYRGVEGLNIQNNISVQGTVGKDGSWGSFADFAGANPYFTKRNSDGSVPKYLDNLGTTDAAVNPLYNAMLISRGDNNIFIVTNNTSIEWRINRDLLLKGALSLRRESNNRVDFRDPSHSSFDGKAYYEKGTYRSSYTTQTSYDANLSANYLKSVKKHNFTLITRANIEEWNSTNEAFVAVGFPEGSVGYPSQSFSYEQGSRPAYQSRMTRNVGVLGAFNYNYDYRYLLDLNYDLEGGSNFGRNKRFQSFWSAGLGWNVDREAFIKDCNWLSRLKLRASYGKNGTQDINVITESVYSYYVGSNFFGQSSWLSQIGNPDLQWQIVTKQGAGLDFGILNENLEITFDVYKHKTDPQ